ncbi:MAG: homocysteine biosynthesis protein, partial [Planctomycetota bacterium]
TVAEINEKIRSGKAVVVDAEEMVKIVKDEGAKKAAERVDVVTTGTFGPMCSTGAFFNIGHTKPKIKIRKAWLNDVPVYCGLAAVDFYLGATEIPDDDPANKVFPGKFAYGGAHVIEDLVRGKKVRIKATAYGTDCYPAKAFEGEIGLEDMNQAVLTNPRNAYQNYNVAVNRDNKRPIYTYMGILRPGLANANYCSAGQLSPLLKDPKYRTIGIGTKIFLGGAEGYVYWEGTQHNPSAARSEIGVTKTPAGTLAVGGDLKKMRPEYLRAASFTGYGVTQAVGLGIPIPILDEDLARTAGAADDELTAKVIDYSTDYPNASGDGPLGEVTYAQLKSGKIEVGGKEVLTAGLSSYAAAKRIAAELKEWVQSGKFLLTENVAAIPGPDSGQKFHGFAGKVHHIE